MIIGVSGKIGSGKDTIARIIQYLTSDVYSKYNKPFSLKGQNDYEFYLSTWKNKKFADKIKDIVCILLNCTRGELEDKEFKEQELGDEWWYFKRIRKKEYDSFSYDLLNYHDYKTIYGNDTHNLIKLTPRLLMQLLGTECGRNIIHPNIWVNSLMSEYKAIPVRDIMEDGEVVMHQYAFPNWIITDLRFPNEYRAIGDRDSITIRINRDLVITGEDYGTTSVTVNQAEKDGIIKPQHESETALDNAEFDYVINNNGTIEELIEQVKIILIKENIL